MWSQVRRHRRDCFCCSPIETSSKRFITTGLLESKFDKLDELVAKINALGGGILCLKSEVYQENCTHIICEKPCRSEKFLGALASGKWIVTPDYIEASFIAKCWLPEDQFEWSCKFAQIGHNIPKFMYEAPLVCRQIFKKGNNKGLLQTWKVVLALGSKERSLVFKRIISAGLGCSVTYGQKAIVWADVTHVFVDEKTKSSTIQLLKLQSLPLLHVDYIRNFLLQQPQPPSSRLFNIKCYKPDSDMNTRTWKDIPKIEDKTTKPVKQVQIGKVDSCLPLTRATSQMAMKKRENGKQPSRNPFTKKISNNPRVALGPLDLYFKLPNNNEESRVKTMNTNALLDKMKLAKPLENAYHVSQKRMRAAKIDWSSVCEGNDTEPPKKQRKVESISNATDPHGACGINIGNICGEVSTGIFEGATPESLVGDSKILAAIYSVCREMNGESAWKPRNGNFIATVRKCGAGKAAREITYMLDEALLSEIVGVKFLEMNVMPLQYLQSMVLHRLITMMMKDDDDGKFSDLIYVILRKTLLYHPPYTVKMQDYYIRVLCQDQQFGVMNCEKACGTVFRVIQYATDEITVTGESIERKQSSREMLLQILVHLFEVDFEHFLSSNEQYDVKLNMRQGMPIVARILWASSKVGYFNNNCKELIAIAVYAARGSSSNSYKAKILWLLWDIVSVVVECCRLTRTKSCNFHVNPLKLNEDVVSLCYFTVQQITDANLCTEDIQVLLGTVRPSWFLAKISSMLLDKLFAELLPKSSESRNKFPEMVETSIRVLSGNCKDLVDENSVRARPVRKRAQANENKGKPSLVNKCNRKGETQLHVACIKNDVQTVKTLLAEAGIDVNVQDNVGWTPLHEACLRGHAECVQQLLKFAAPKTKSAFGQDNNGPRTGRLDLAVRSESGATALHDAVINNHLEVADMLLQHGGSELLNIKMTNKKTAFDLAATDKMKTLLQSYANMSVIVRQPSANPAMKLTRVLFLSLMSSYGEASGVGRVWSRIAHDVDFISTDRGEDLQRKLSSGQLLMIASDLQAMNRIWKFVSEKPCT